MRHLKASEIGSLISVNAIVVRTTDVKPFLKVACYACDICGFEAYQFIGKDLIKIVSNESNMTSGLNYDIKIDYRQSGGRLSLIHYYYSDL